MSFVPYMVFPGHRQTRFLRENPVFTQVRDMHRLLHIWQLLNGHGVLHYTSREIYLFLSFG